MSVVCYAAKSNCLAREQVCYIIVLKMCSQSWTTLAVQVFEKEDSPCADAVGASL